MDPIATLSLACNILQVVELGCELASVFKQAYQNGTTEENTVLSTHAQNLRSAAELVQTGTTRPDNHTETKLLSVAQECIDAAAELQKTVASTTSSSSRRREKFKVGFKAIWNKKNIEKSASRLRSCQKALDTRVLVDLRSRVDLVDLDARQGIQHLEQRLLAFIHEQASLQRKEHELTRIAVHDEGNRLATKIENLQISNGAESQYERLLSSLVFSGMNARKNQISEAHIDTFEWIFKSHSDAASPGVDDYDSGGRLHDAPWNDFVEWLRNGDDAYWISGKPGSGKSTLMSFIYSHRLTETYLEEWASPDALGTADAYFWNAGVEAQKSVEGLLATLASQTFMQFREVAVEFLHQYSHMRQKRIYRDWSKKELKEALVFVIRNAKAKFCFFVDGLDEVPITSFDAQWQVLDLVRELSTHENIKICVSSRPLKRFENSFSQNPRLRLQQLNQKDIEQYYEDELEPAIAETAFMIDTHVSSTLKFRFLSKAEGIFLWACLAVGSLKRGLGNLDSQEQLLARLNEMPGELEDMYEHMWKRHNPDIALYRTEAATIFRHLLLETTLRGPPLTVLSLALSFPGNETVRNRCLEGQIPLDLSEVCNFAHSHVLARCAGMLEILPVSSSTWYKSISLPDECPEVKFARGSRIVFIHRTARDFLHLTLFGQSLISSTAVTDEELHRDRVFSMLAELCISDEPPNYDQIYQLLDSHHLTAASTCESGEAFLLTEIERRFAAKFVKERSLHRPDPWFAALKSERLCLNAGKRSAIIEQGNLAWANLGHALDFLGATLALDKPSLVKFRLKDASKTISPRYCQYLLCCITPSWIYNSKLSWCADSYAEVLETLLQRAFSNSAINSQLSYKSPEAFYFPTNLGVATSVSAFAQVLLLSWSKMSSVKPDDCVLTYPIYLAEATSLIDIESETPEQLLFAGFPHTFRFFEIGDVAGAFKFSSATGMVIKCKLAFFVHRVYEELLKELDTDPESDLWARLESWRGKEEPQILLTYQKSDSGSMTYHQITEEESQTLWSALASGIWADGFRPCCRNDDESAGKEFETKISEVHARGEKVDVVEFLKGTENFKDLEDPDVSWVPPPMYENEDTDQYERDRRAILEACQPYKEKWEAMRAEISSGIRQDWQW